MLGCMQCRPGPCAACGLWVGHTCSTVTNTPATGHDCAPRKLLVMKGGEWSDATGARSPGLENQCTQMLLTPMAGLSTSPGLSTPPQERRTFRTSLASSAIPFPLTEHADRGKVLPGKLGLCMSLQGPCSVRTVCHGLRGAAGPRAPTHFNRLVICDLKPFPREFVF